MEEGAPTLLLCGAKQLLDLARAETSGAAEAYAMLAARVLSHGAGQLGQLVLFWAGRWRVRRQAAKLVGTPSRVERPPLCSAGPHPLFLLGPCRSPLPGCAAASRGQQRWPRCSSSSSTRGCTGA